MTEVLLPFAVSALVIIAAGAALTHFGDQLATRTGFGRLLVGSVVLALATALPEVMIDIHAARLGNPDLAVGDLMGSSLFNLSFLAIADLLHRAPGGAFGRQSLPHALPATASIVVTSLAGMAILAREAQLGLGTLGLGPIAILCGYVFALRLVYRDQVSGTGERPRRAAEGSAERGGVAGPVLGVVACAAAIFVAAPHLARSADTLARESGLGGTFIGTSLLALCTSLPELVTTLTAVRVGAFEMAAGNIFGTNAINMVMLLPVDVAYDGRLLHDVSITHAFTALAIVLVTTVAVMGQLYRVESRKAFVEPDALLVISLCLAALAAVYVMREPALAP